jgi:putative salt-induced outer membrane protein YdiY
MHLRKCLLALASLALVQFSNADLIITKDGSQLSGTITLIDRGVVHLDTAYAGSLKIKQDQIESFETDEPVVVRLESGTVMAGRVESSTGETLRIASQDGVLETNTGKVAASWSPTAEDPEVVRNRSEWRYDAALDIAGKSGNTEKFSTGIDLKAELKGPNDALAFFFEYDQAEEEDNKTEDNIAGGVSFESFFSGDLGWYARTELEQDRIDEIDLRSTTGAGLSYRFINEPNQTLVARAGIGYQHTSFDANIDDESSATIDFGLAHEYEYKELFVIDTNLTVVPQTDDFGNYRIEHDTGIELPIGNSGNWKIRMGVENEYESEPVTDENLDTSYYTRMVYSWR